MTRLENTGRIWWSLAKNHKAGPHGGRDSEIPQCYPNPFKEKQNNPVLIGGPGVGKTAIAEELSAAVCPRRHCLLNPEGQKALFAGYGPLIAVLRIPRQFEEGA